MPTASIVDFLNTILPYLVIKKLQAELLLEYFERCHIPIHTKAKMLTEENIVLRMVIFDELRDLNRKGKR